jgi:hypothetical protein
MMDHPDQAPVEVPEVIRVEAVLVAGILAEAQGDVRGSNAII